MEDKAISLLKAVAITVAILALSMFIISRVRSTATNVDDKSNEQIDKLFEEINGTSGTGGN